MNLIPKQWSLGHIRGHRTFISMVTRFKQYRNINTSAASSQPHQLWKEIYSEIITATFVIKPEKLHFAQKNKVKSLGSIPPRTSFYLFATLIRPILLYGSDVWGISRPNNDAIDKVFYQYVRCVLTVKATTSNVMVIGESGQLPPSVFSHINVLSYMGSLQTLPAHTVVKRIYTELSRLHSCGLHTWVTKV